MNKDLQKKRCNSVKKTVGVEEIVDKLIDGVKAEAIKEFAEKIKQVLELNDLEEYNYVCKLLDTLVKEMVGEQ